MTKQTELEKIKDLLIGPAKDQILTYFQGVYSLISEGKVSTITIAEACQILQENKDIEVLIFTLCGKKWSWDAMAFVGDDSKFIPEIFADMKYQVIDVDDPATVQTVLELRLSEKGGWVDIKKTSTQDGRNIPGEALIIAPQKSGK